MPADQPAFASPEMGTGSAFSFYATLKATSEVVLFAAKVAVFADNAAHVATLLTKHEKSLPKDFDPLKPLSDSPGPFRKQLISQSQTLNEMVLARLVDNFTTYLSDLIRECLQKRPEILRSKENVTLEFVMQAGSLHELYESLVDRKVDELAYLGFVKLAEWIKSRLGVDFLPRFEARSSLIELLETRNCIIHNRAKTSEKFLRAVGAQDMKGLVGVPIDVDFEIVYLAIRATAECVALLDPETAEKFDLPVRKINQPFSATPAE